MRWRLTSLSGWEQSRISEFLRSYPRAVLLACTLITIGYFARAEARLLSLAPPYWWTWWDQGKYLESVFAFATGDLAATRHWYPVGYALLAAPFANLFRTDPFVIVNILCLVGSLWAFVRLCETFGISRVIGAAIFLATSVFTPSILLHYVIPWSSTPTTFLILAGLALGFSPPSYTRAFLLGLMPGLIIMTKPVDAIALAPLAVYYAVECLRARPTDAIAKWNPALRLVGMGVVGLAAGLGAAAIARWLVHGWTLSAFERQTTEGAVFIISSLPIKLYSLFVDPTIIYGHYLAPEGIFSRYPWVFAGTCGMTLMLFRDLRLAVLTLCAAVYIAMYAAYYDMIPNGLWHYNNIHYYTWCFPIFGLFAFVLVRRLLSESSVSDTAIVVLASVLLMGWRPVLRPVMATVEVETGTTARIYVINNDVPFVVDLDGSPGNAAQVFVGSLKVRWGDRDLLPMHDSRVLPTERGARAVLLRVGNGRSLIISWEQVNVTDVRRVTLYKLDWNFL
jgi:hypothetical protein